MSTQRFEQGKAYGAAIDWPFYVPEGAAVDALTDEGWQVVSVEACNEANVPYELPPGCGDTYDTWGVGIRQGPTYDREMPDAFVYVGDLSGAPAPGETPPPPQPSPPECTAGAKASQASVTRAWWTGVAVGAGGVAAVGLVGLVAAWAFTD